MKMFVIYNVKCVNTPEGVLVTSHSIYTKNHVSSIIKKSHLKIFVITVNITKHVIP